VLIPAGQVAAGKLAGAMAYGAEVIQIDGSFDDALVMVRESAERFHLAIVNSINPYRLEGQKTLSFEISDALGEPPAWLALPVGNAGNISAAWLGFGQLAKEEGQPLPHLLGVQAAGAAPLVVGHAVDQPRTIASAIRIGRPARGEQAVAAAEESGGRIVAASDAMILEAQRMLAAEGIWVEPASAAGIAGLKQEIEAGRLDPSSDRVVAVCTGHGLKDPGIITDRYPEPARIPARLDALEQMLKR
jgi:threonine synthase